MTSVQEAPASRTSLLELELHGSNERGDPGQLARGREGWPASFEQSLPASSL